MKYLTYDPSYLEPLTSLIKAHLRLVPPYTDVDEKEVSSILDNPSRFCDIRFQTPTGKNIVLMGVADTTLICAAQLVLIPDDTALIYWFGGKQECKAELTEFVSYINTFCRETGCHYIQLTKNAFGLGWEGLPDSWLHLMEAFISVGYEIEDSWFTYWCNNIGNLDHTNLAEGFTAKFEYTDNGNSYEASFFYGDKEIGEATIWLPLDTAKSLSGFFDLESIEIYKPYREKGFGQAAISSVCNEMQKHGYHGFILSTENNNLPMQNLAKKCGLLRGPNLDWIKTYQL